MWIAALWRRADTFSIAWQYIIFHCQPIVAVVHLSVAFKTNKRVINGKILHPLFLEGSFFLLFNVILGAYLYSKITIKARVHRSFNALPTYYITFTWNFIIFFNYNASRKLYKTHNLKFTCKVPAAYSIIRLYHLLSERVHALNANIELIQYKVFPNVSFVSKSR